MRRGGFDGRYRIVDEPRTPFFARFAIPPLILLPVTTYFALMYSPLLWLLPGLNGLIVAGNHKWRDVGLSVLALVLFIAGVVTNGLLYDAGLLRGLTLSYAKDFVLALTVFPLIKILFDQYFTISMRQALRDQV